MFSDSSVAAGVSPAQPTRLPPQKSAPLATVLPSKQASITKIKTGVISSLQEDETRYYAIAVINKTNDHLKLGTVSWLKEPLESWRTRAESQVRNAITAPGSNYTLPKISEGGCIDDMLTPTAGAPSARSGNTAVWTGSEMIIWGGYTDLNTGGRYNPSTDTWTITSTTNAPSGRYNHTAVWTGSEMIIWGGADENGLGVNTGGKYNPGTDSWTATSATNAPDARNSHTAVWTGSEMIVWGGLTDLSNLFNTGGRYNPNTDT
jgi:hypothetical protein